MGTTTCLEVDFSGARSGTSHLTWSQRWMWDEVVWFAPHHEHLNMKTVVAVPDSAGMATVLRAVRALIEAREPLRTTYHLSPAGEPYQTVVAEGRLAVEVREAPADTGRSAAEELGGDLSGPAFGPDELPVRIGIVTGHGKPRFVVLVVFHMATDAWDMRNLTDELRRLVALPPGERTEAGGRIRQPLDKARLERGPDGERTCAKSIRYWRTQAAVAPATVLPRPDPAGTSGPFHEICLGSDALTVAVHALAGRVGVSPSTVLTAITASLLGVRSASDACCLTVYCNNRIEKWEETASGIYIEDVPLCVDLAGARFADIARRTWRTTMAAYSFGQYDPPRARSAVLEVGRDRGVDIDLSCTLNVNLPAGGAGRAATTRETAAKLGSNTEIIWERSLHQDRPGRRFYLGAGNYAGRSGFALRADTAILSRSDILEFLLDIERVAVRLLADETVDIHSVVPG